MDEGEFYVVMLGVADDEGVRTCAVEVGKFASPDEAKEWARRQAFRSASTVLDESDSTLTMQEVDIDHGVILGYSIERVVDGWTDEDFKFGDSF